MLSQFGANPFDTGVRSDMYRQTLQQIFHSHSKLEIPIMQRRFCWGDNQLDKWAVDTLRVALLAARSGIDSNDAESDCGSSSGEDQGEEEEEDPAIVHQRVEQQISKQLSRDQGSIVHPLLYSTYAKDVKRYPIGSSCRNAKLARFRIRDDKSSLLVIDGQQRLVVTTMLILAIRDAMFNHRDWETHSHLCNEHLDAIHQVLFSSPTDLESLPNQVQQLKEGDILSCVRLIPSHPDRLVFYNLLCRNGLELAARASPDHLSFRTFVARQRFGSFVEPLTISQLCNLAHSALCGVSVMSNHLIAPNLNLCAVFQWFQQIGISGAKFFTITNPGVPFHTLDFVRNFFISICMDHDFDTQNQIYRVLWYTPFEQKVGLDWRRFDGLLEKFIQEFGVDERSAVEPAQDPRVPEGVAQAYMHMKEKEVRVYLQFLVFYYQHCDNGVYNASSEEYDDDDEVVIIEEDEYENELQPGVLSRNAMAKLLAQFEKDRVNPLTANKDIILAQSRQSFLGFIRHLVWFSYTIVW
ncbi:UNVERIFIED_CONTAM: hypothetical protein HDU68_002479 [Siphonaria sp. JEL0065]|nr:hypothetical protein HDU68_002479 [Siphonaria sp. JEL0065]